MAKIVLAGEANCPYYARAEILADNLQTNLPDFRIHKIVKHPHDWKIWLTDMCQKNGWSHSKSPLIWRELIDRGGKGVLIGGSNEFQEYAIGYYGIASDMFSSDMTKIGSENMGTYSIFKHEEEYNKSLSTPVNICITNTAKLASYHMLHQIARGEVMGPETELSFRLLVKEEELEDAEGIKLESIDLACPLLREVTVTTDIGVAMSQASLVIILDDLSQLEDETWECWIKRCAERYRKYGSAINENANSECKVVVAGCGARNLGAYVINHDAHNIAKQNIVVPSRLAENQAKSAIARRIAVNSSGVVDILVWGNAGGTTHLDMSRGRVHGCEGAIWGPTFYSRPIKDMVHDDKWLQSEYLQLLRSYNETVVGALKHPAAVSEAHSIVAMLSDWWNGSRNGEMFSMGVLNEGWYEIPEGLFFSLPVKYQQGNWRVVQDLDITEEVKVELGNIVEELRREIEVIFPSPNKVNIKPKVSIQEPENLKAEKVFGEGKGDPDNVSDSNTGATDRADSDGSEKRPGPLTRIIEENESDSKDGSPTTKTTEK